MTHGSKVFGIGLSRTGTASLTKALRLLGYRAAHFPLSILSFEGERPALNAPAAARFAAMTDTPVALLYRELDRAFPGSKFILTTRDPESWLASMRRLRRSYAFLRLVPKIRKLTRALYGPKAYADEAELRARLGRHTEAVLDYFGPRAGRDLLILDVRAPDAWRKLVAFLKEERSAAPFPHENRGYRTSIETIADFFAA